VTLEKIVSFGWKHGAPVQQPHQVVIDIRRMFRNPYREPHLKDMNGLDPEVGEYIEQSPNFNVMYLHLKQQASVTGVRTVYIGCMGGQHRSVFLAEKLGKELGVPVEHRDLRKLQLIAGLHT
jgi:UPF0042 nucleotide-binding protein